MSDTNSFHTPPRVTLTRGEWADPDRGGRMVPYKLYLPEGEDKIPLIIWSHGLGGTRDGAGFLARFIAARGYAHLHIQHPGSDDSLWRNQPDLHPWDAIRQNMPLPWDDVKARYLDMPFVVNLLKDGTAFDAAIMNRLDIDKMGLCGHSFGALSTQIAAGQWTGESDDSMEKFSVADAFKAGILYSPNPNFRLTIDPAKIYDFDIPLFFMTGTRDDSPVKGFDYTARIDIFRHADKQNHALFVQDGADHMVYNGSRGQLEAYEGIETHQQQICEASLLWWDHYLKGQGRDLEAGMQSIMQSNDCFERHAA